MNKKEKERITILVAEEIKNKWQDFSKNKKYSTLSKFIRELLNFLLIII